MKPREYGVGGPEFTSVEQLLSEAATWEPDAPAPEGLAGRALAYERERQDRERTLRSRERRAGLFGGLFLGASTVSATVALAFFHFGPQAPRVSPPPGMNPEPRPAELAAALASSGVKSPTLSRSKPVRTPFPATSRRAPRLAGTGTTRTRVRTRAAVPVAIWREETVRREVAGVLSAGWLVRQNPEDGSLIITPGLLDIQTDPADACGGPRPMELPAAAPSSEGAPTAAPPSTPSAASMTENPAPPVAAPVPDADSHAPAEPES